MAWVERWAQEMSPAAEGNSTEGHPPLSRDDALSKPELEDKLRSLRQVMRHINDLMGTRHTLSTAELTARLGFLQGLAASQLRGGFEPWNEKIMSGMEAATRRLAVAARDMDDGEFLKRILDLL